MGGYCEEAVDAPMGGKHRRKTKVAGNKKTEARRRADAKTKHFGGIIVASHKFGSAPGISTQKNLPRYGWNQKK
jgi:hypothetical protein